MQMFYMARFNQKKLNYVEGKERHQVKSEISLQHWNEEMIM
jgi:hypothetical protein